MLDVPKVHARGACVMLGEKCCFYINESGHVVINIEDIKISVLDLHRIVRSEQRVNWLVVIPPPSRLQYPAGVILSDDLFKCCLKISEKYYTQVTSMRVVCCAPNMQLSV